MKKDIRYRLLAVGEIVGSRDEEFVAGAGWCPVGAHCVGKKVEDDDMPMRRGFARHRQAADQQGMDLGKALEITRAVDVFFAKHFDGDDEAQRQIRQERLSALFDAMERHGNADGTETQLGDAAEFLRLAFDSMSPKQQAEFLDSQAVTEFIARESGEEEA